MKRLEGMLFSSKDVQSGQRLFFFPLVLLLLKFSGIFS